MMKNYQVNDEGYYGEYGGAYIPESLKPCVEELKSKYTVSKISKYSISYVTVLRNKVEME